MVNPDILQVAAGALKLERYPALGPANLRAWDAADEYLLKQLAEESLPAAGQKILIVNDTFGALGVALATANTAYWNDSHLARLALTRNLELNGQPGDAVPFIPADVAPRGGIDLVLMKFPKSLAWQEDSLLRLRPCLNPGAGVWAGGMIKHTPRRAFTLLEKCIGPTVTNLGWKKARLAFATFDPDLDCPAGLDDAVVTVPEFDLTLSSGTNVFSRDKLDIGTRFLLEHLPRLEGRPRIADLGCGSGVLALAMKRLVPGAEIIGVDESYQAIASAQMNARAAGLEAQFQVMDGFAELGDASCDLVLCNPPFHQDRTVGDQTARSMFYQSRRVLKSGGELRVVGNRHLGYHARLSELFGGCAVVAENDKFVVLRAAQTGPGKG
jgi:23S rRNA (guanine1835-N2)-methyltransferase